MNRPKLLALLFASACLLAACGRGPAELEETPDALTLYSLDGRDRILHEERAKASETFHGYPVLGKTEVTDPAARRALASALAAGIAKSDGTVAKCFWPRHGLRVVRQKDGPVDYVICFQCLQLVENKKGVAKTVATTRGPQPVFDKALRDAGLPLAPEGGG